ncbi:DUF503 domain-containing protein [Zongyangia hominis]|uniref:DUF503 domain-containing protein n=1 Tax=Zongyangia hominis TaxID=2763677 RepID=A0A926EAH1_9FIRM|nr:DUF503 domain-containing protein [Zongyangia hominis]MBC8570307.1 DUF503 domain-containing protein [Zongyangia hominis]
MVVSSAVITLHAPWVHSLKEKRREVKSLLAKARQRLGVSAAETGSQDKHQLMELGFAWIAADAGQNDSIWEALVDLIETNTQAQIIRAERELR